MRPQRRRAERWASRTHLQALCPKTCRGRAQGTGIGLKPPTQDLPRRAGTAQGRRPLPQSPYVFIAATHRDLRRPRIPRAAPGRLLQPTVPPDPTESRGVAPSRTTRAATPASAVATGCPARPAELRAWGSGPTVARRDLETTGSWGKSREEPRGDVPLCCRCSCPSPRCAATPARECAGPRSPHLPALISAATRSRVVPVLLQPDAPARRCGARPRDATPVRGSAALLTAEPARRAAAATPRASPAPSAPPLGPPLSCPSPPRSAPPPPRCGGAHPGKCRRRVPATPPSRSSSRATDYKFQQAARPAHALTGEAAEAKQARPPAAAPRSLRSCHRGLAAGLAGGLAGASS